MVTERVASRTHCCAVCSGKLSSHSDRCPVCRWPSVDVSGTNCLTDRELASYRARLELARSRWRELGRYDQSPRQLRIPVSKTPDVDSRRFAGSALVRLSDRDVKAAALSSTENSIGGALL